MLLGIDIGGTTINIGLVEEGRVIRTETIPSFTPNATKAETLNYLAEAIMKALVPEVESVGIGVPSIVDPVKGIVYQAVNIPSWDEVCLKDELEWRLKIPVHINNDSNCFAVGAAAKLDRVYPVMVGITLGTGLGMGVIKDGELFCGTEVLHAARLGWQGTGLEGCLRRPRGACNRARIRHAPWEPSRPGDVCLRPGLHRPWRRRGKFL